MFLKYKVGYLFVLIVEDNRDNHKGIRKQLK